MDWRRWALIGSLVLPLGCSDAPQLWTRVTFTNDDGTPIYRIAQADPIHNTCTRIELYRPSEVSEWLADRQAQVDIRVEGLEGYVVREATVWHPVAQDDDYPIARRCSTALSTSDVGPPAPILSGTLEFAQRTKAAGETRPCRVSFALTVSQHPIWDDPKTESFEVVADGVAIDAIGCPHPDNYVATFTELDAAYAELNGLGTVVVSSWDEASEVCVWARLLSSGEALASLSEVEVEGAWVYSGLRVATIAREACVASELLDPNLVDADLSTTAGPLQSRGSVGFGATTSVQTVSGALDVPCALDVDVELQSYGEHYWVPDITRMQAKQVAVAGACD